MACRGCRRVVKALFWAGCMGGTLFASCTGFIRVPRGSVDITDDHDPGAITDVCGAPALVSFATQVQPVFTANCAFGGCHGGATPQLGMNLSAGLAYANIVGVAAVELATMDRIEVR